MLAELKRQKTARTARRWQALSPYLIVVAATVALHARALGGAFLNWDDDRFITANPLFAADGWGYVRAALTSIQFDAYHPLHLLSYLPDRWLWAAAPAGYRAVSVALLAADAALLVALAQRRGATAAGAVFAALLFAAHPLVIEPVAWISARKDLLALLFFLIALLVEDRRDPNLRRPAWSSLALFAAALLAKTSTVAFPLVLFAWLVWLRRARPRTALLRALPHAAVAAVVSLVVVAIWRDHQMIPTSRPAAVPVDVAATIATYLGRIIWPADLSPIYPAAPPAAGLAAAALLVIVGALALSWRRLPGAARFAAVAFAAAILPVANLVPVVFRFADRYVFLALAMLVVPLALVLRARVAYAAAAALLAAEIAIAVPLQRAWRDSDALWARAVAAQPDALFARLKRGETLRDAGRFPEATAEYQAAVRLEPDNALGWAGLFHMYATRAEKEGRLAPGTAAGWLRALGPALADRGRFAELLRAAPRDACAPCSNTLLLLGLIRWPERDEALVAAARAALDRGLRDVALISLSRVRARTPEVESLEAAATP